MPTLANRGPGCAWLDFIELRAAEGDTLPLYQNSTYIDYNLWPQGWQFDDPASHRRDDLLLGVIPGNGMTDGDLRRPGRHGTQGIAWSIAEGLRSDLSRWGYSRTAIHHLDPSRARSRVGRLQRFGQQPEHNLHV